MQQSEPYKSKQQQDINLIGQNNDQQGGLQVTGRNIGNQNQQQQQYEDIFNDDDSILFDKQKQQQMQQKRGFQMQKTAQDYYSSSHAPNNQQIQPRQLNSQITNNLNFLPPLNNQRQQYQQYQQQQQQQQQQQTFQLPQQQPQLQGSIPQQNKQIYNQPQSNSNANQLPSFNFNYNQSPMNNFNANMNKIPSPPLYSFNQQQNQYQIQNAPIQSQFNTNSFPPPLLPQQAPNLPQTYQQNPIINYNFQGFGQINNQNNNFQNQNNIFQNQYQNNNFAQQNSFNFQSQYPFNPYDKPKDSSSSIENLNKLPAIGSVQNRYQQSDYKQDKQNEGNFQQLTREGYLSQHPLFRKQKEIQRNKIASYAENFEGSDLEVEEEQSMDSQNQLLQKQPLNKQPNELNIERIIQEPRSNKHAKTKDNLDLNKHKPVQTNQTSKNYQSINLNLSQKDIKQIKLSGDEKSFDYDFEEIDQSLSRSQSRSISRSEQRDQSRQRDRSRLGEKKKKKEKVKIPETHSANNLQIFEVQRPLQITGSHIQIAAKQIPQQVEQLQKRETLSSQKVLRTMKDIQGESLRTSHCFQAQSFKWTSKIKSFSQTIKKGNLMSIVMQKQQYINIQKKQKAKIQQDDPLSLIPELEEFEIHQQRQVSKSLGNTDITTNPMIQDKILIFNDLDMESKTLISQPANTFLSVDNFAQQITLFKKKLAKLQQDGLTPNIQFYFHSNIDNGSFGKVDLYFFNQNNLNLQETTVQQQPFNSEHVQPEMSSYDISLQSNQISQEAKFSDIIPLNSSQQISDIFQSQKQLSDKSTRSSNNNFSTLESASQLNSGGMFISQSQREKISLLVNSQKKQAINILPAAGKKIKKEDEFIRELFIMQSFQSQYMPMLFGQDINQQILFMEFGLCNLFHLKQDSIKNNYRFSDEFTYQALLNIINAIESFLSFKDPETGELKPMFHSDIKPQNIILTAQKENDLQSTQIQLLLIDYGGASIEKEDYWTYYTPAFVNNKLWSKFVNDQNYQDKILWEEIRFAEVYAACRSIQYIIIEKDKQHLFKKESTLQFMKEYWQLYPRTTRLINTIYQLEQKGKIDRIVINSYAKQEQNRNKDQYNKHNIEIKRDRQLIQCSQYCFLCSNGYCLQCAYGRVLPDCNCRNGYYEDSNQNCQQCGDNCKTCIGQSTCQVCNEHYKLVNNQCTCDGCDNTNLYYTTQIGADLRSIVITFNQIIGIKKTSLSNISNAFTLSYDNCSILAQETQQYFGVFQTTFDYGGCYIRQSQQNQFIIMFTSNLDYNNILKAPKIDSSQILIFNGIPIYNSLQQGVTATTTETQIGQQVGYIPKICQFQQQKMVASLSENILYIAITTVLPFDFFSATSGYINCQIVQSSQPGITLSPCSDAQGLQIPTQQFIDKSVLQVSVECTFLGYKTKDIIDITFTNQNAQNITTQYDSLLFKSFFKDNFQAQVSFFSEDALSQIQLNYAVYPPTSFAMSQQLFSESYNVTFSILGSSVMTEQMILISLTAYTQNAVNTVEFGVQYLSSFSLDVDKKSISNFFPSQSLIIKASLIDNDFQTTDISQFQFYWVCVSEDTQAKCKDRNQNIINLDSQLTLQINPYTLNLNGKFSIYILAKRQNQPNTQQIAVTSIDTGQTSFTVLTDMNSIQMINYQDIIFIELKYQTNLYTTNQTCTYKATILNSLNQAQKTYQSISNKLSFIIQDLFPSLDLTVQNSLSIQFSVYDSTINETLTSNSYTMQIRQPPTGCKLSLGSQSAFVTTTISVNSCNLNGQVTKYQFFYYSSLEQQAQEIQASGTIVNRRMLSIITENTKATVNLPPGNIIVMVVTIGPNNLRSNFTQTTTIQDNNFSSIEYEKYLQNQYNLAQQQPQKNDQIFNYQYFTNAVEYYESKNLNYTPSESINQLKNQIIQQLTDPSWQNEDNQVYLLSTQVSVRIKNSKIIISSNSSQEFVNANQKQIQNILQQISSSQLNNQQRQYYQETLASLGQDYMKNMNNLNNWEAANCQYATQQYNNIMQGIAQTMIVNQQPIQVITDGVSLLVDRVDYISLLSKYYNDNSIIPGESQSSQSYYVQIQNWPTTHPLYRNELSQINQQYFTESTQDQLNLLQKTYPIMIPNILEDGKRRRQLSTTNANLPGPFQLQFPTQDEKLQCTQRNLNGKWVSSSCKTSIKFINQKRIVNCSCQTPGPTSIITDITQLFDNKNIQDIFNGEGFMRIFHLSNWYEYAPIWTIIGLNVFFIVLLIIGNKQDKIDRSNDLKKAFIFYNSKLGQSSTNGQENLFMQIKNQRTTQNKLSINPISQINTQKTQEQNEDQEANSNNNNKINLEYNKKSIFFEGDNKIQSNNQVCQKTPINSFKSENLASINFILQQKQQDSQNDNEKQQLDNQTKVLSENKVIQNEIIFENASQVLQKKDPQNQDQEKNQNDKQKIFEESSNKNFKMAAQNVINQENKLNSQNEILCIDLNANNEVEKQKKQLKDSLHFSQNSSDFQKIDERENYLQNSIKNLEFKIKKEFKKDEFYIYEEQDYSIYSSNLDKKFEGEQQSDRFQFQITPENQGNIDTKTPNIENNQTPCIDQSNNDNNNNNPDIENTPQIEARTSQLEAQAQQIQHIDIQKLFIQQEEENSDNFQPTPQPNSKAEHNFLLKDDQIVLEQQQTKQDENILQIQNQDSKNQQQQQEFIKLNNNYSDEEAMKITLDQKNENKENAQNLKEQKEIDKRRQKEIEIRLFLNAKQKLQLYLQKETIIRAVFAYHMFFQTFIIYNNKISRVLRFTIYYNRLIWLLTINSVFGVKLSVIQVIVLSIVSTIIIQIVTSILTLLYFQKKLQIFGVVVTSLFLLFCYYSILVVISGQQPYDANIWIVSYFSTLFLSDYIYGLGISFAMFYLSKKYIEKIQNPLYLNILGSALLIQAFQE
ncbi:hypothetical protein ABPG74_022521 [Tetrahymena malaccensis]